jgi:hypothetical protein
MPLEFGGYLGNGIVGCGDEDKLSDVSNCLLFVIRLATGDASCELVSRRPAAAGHRYHRIAPFLQSYC